MSQISELLLLQELDEEAARLRARLTEVERLLGGDAELDAARQQLATAEAAAAPVRKDEARLDAQVKALSGKIEQEEKKLYSGTVTSPKELQNIQHEVDSLKEQRARVSDSLIETEVRLEDLTGRLESAAATVAELDQRRTAQVDGWQREQKTLNAAIASAEAKRLGQQSNVDSRFLAVYERVRQRRGSMAVAKVQGSTCSACRVSMPDSVRKQVFRPESLVQCPNCERILFLG